MRAELGLMQAADERPCTAISARFRRQRRVPPISPASCSALPQTDDCAQGAGHQYVVEGLSTMLQRLIGENIELVWRAQPDLWPVKMDQSRSTRCSSISP